MKTVTITSNLLNCHFIKIFFHIDNQIKRINKTFMPEFNDLTAIECVCQICVVLDLLSTLSAGKGNYENSIQFTIQFDDRPSEAPVEN